LENLLSAWPAVAVRIRLARHILLLADYDGTLTPIVERPELANLSSFTRGLLRSLARRRNYTVGIVGGRALSDLKTKVGIDGMFTLEITAWQLFQLADRYQTIFGRDIVDMENVESGSSLSQD
jgi:hypothetical protein